MRQEEEESALLFARSRSFSKQKVLLLISFPAQFFSHALRPMRFPLRIAPFYRDFPTKCICLKSRNRRGGQFFSSPPSFFARSLLLAGLLALRSPRCRCRRPAESCDALCLLDENPFENISTSHQTIALLIFKGGEILVTRLNFGILEGQTKRLR